MCVCAATDPTSSFEWGVGLWLGLVVGWSLFHIWFGVSLYLFHTFICHFFGFIVYFIFSCVLCTTLTEDNYPNSVLSDHYIHPDGAAIEESNIRR